VYSTGDSRDPWGKLGCRMPSTADL
jgi:hypothetical protein